MLLRHYLIGLLFITSSLNSAISQHLTQLIPNGEIPNEISTSLVPFSMLEKGRKLNTFKLSSSKDYDRSVDHLLSSGMVVFGTPGNQVGQQILDRITSSNGMDKNLEFFMFRSSLFRSFQTSNGSVVVTTGLIAQLSSEGQLAYYIARELAVKNLGFKDWEVKEVKTIHDYDDVLNLIWARSISREKQIDVEALRLLSKSGYDLNDLTSALVVYTYSAFPFEDVMIDETDFANDFVSFPSRYFDRNNLTPSKVESNSELENSIRQRIESLGGKFEMVLNQSNDNSFIELRNHCRIENILTRIIKGDNLNAIYESLVLKKQNTTLVLYSKLEALAWLGHLQFVNNRTKPNIKTASFLSFSKSASFFNFIKIMNAEAQTAICLRKLKDLSKEFPTENFFSTVYSKALLISKESKQFNYVDFQSKYDLFSKKNIDTRDSLSRNSKISSLEDEKISLKEKEMEQYFYLLLIPDILNDLSKVKDYEKTSIQYSNCIDVKIHNKKSVSDKKTNDLNAKIDPLGTSMRTTSLKDDYFKHYIFNTTLIQAMNNIENGKSFLPYTFETLSNYNNDNNISYNIFKERRCIYFKPSYFIGLTGFGLVYVIPEMILNRSRTVQTFFNTDHEGFIVNYCQFHFKDRLTKHQIKGRLYYSNNFNTYEISHDQNAHQHQ
jgi:hypothetical protein